MQAKAQAGISIDSIESFIFCLIEICGYYIVSERKYTILLIIMVDITIFSCPGYYIRENKRDRGKGYAS